MKTCRHIPEVRISRITTTRIFVVVFLFLPLLSYEASGDDEGARYKEPEWKPRAILPTADTLGNAFWPPSPVENVDFADATFVASRLRPAPAPGIFPRVLLTPGDVEEIQAKVALGEKAPAAFRVMWEREIKKQSPFYALVMEDRDLGRTLAGQLVDKMNALGPKLDAMDQRPDSDNLWAVERSVVASGDPDPPTEIWALLDYDYLHKWMTPEERKQAEGLITRITKGRVSNFMVKPDHFLMNNHKMFGMGFLRMLMLIEGTEGFDQAVYDNASQKARVMLDYYLYPAGNCFESIKGWLNNSVYVALARRHPELLKHSRLRAKMDFFQHAMRWEDGRWKIREEMRASAFHVIWMMRYFRPEDPAMDWLYRATFTTHEFLNDPNARWPDPVGINSELLLLFAEEGLMDKDGKPLDWSDPERIEALGLPLTWVDDRGGNVITRNSWKPDDLMLGFTTKQDFYYGGHEGSETNRFVLWKDGVNWARDSDLLAVKATSLQNMLTIDGKGLDWPPAPARWLGVQETREGVAAAGDGKMGYDFAKVMQVHPLDFPSAQLPYYRPFAAGNYDATRDHQIAFHPGTVKWNDGFAHTDYGPWSGETRLVESYRVNNPVEQAYRTVYMGRGEHPYVLVFDDARKDGEKHLYEWNMTVPEGIDLLDAKTREVLFQSVPPGADRESDLVLGRASSPRDEKTGRAQMAKDDPLLLVRTLWRNTSYGYPVPSYEKLPIEPHRPYAGLGKVTVPAISEEPEFRILLYPHRQGDPQPETRWSEDRRKLSLRIGDVTDRFHFGVTDGGRTAFSVERNGKQIFQTGSSPARPTLEVRGTVFDPVALRDTRRDGEVPRFVFDGSTKVKIPRPSAPAFLVYSLDGSEPTATSPRYEKPIEITGNATLTARVIDPEWTAGPQESAVVRADFVQVKTAVGESVSPSGSRPGLLARVYEKKTVLWDDRGFFQADRVMLPDLDLEKPAVTSLVEDFILPWINPQRPHTEQAKGFYRFNGWFEAPEPGVYRIAVDSCGPVFLKVGGQVAIEEGGVFHQQQAVREGDAVLGAGWHALELIVTDPLLWNVVTVEEMPFSVRVRHEGGAWQDVATAGLRAVMGDQKLDTPPALAWKDAGTPSAWMELGLVRSTFDRTGLHREPGFLDVGGESPRSVDLVENMAINPRPGLVQVYDGWFFAPEEGVYRFDMPAKKTSREHLSDLSAAYQNQLRIHDDIIVQRGVHGRRTTGQIGLKEGWHPISIRLGGSEARATVTYPDGESLPLTAQLLQRPASIRIGPPEATARSGNQEIFGPTEVTMTLPEGRQGTIRFTTDGSEPTASSREFCKPVMIDRDTKVRAAAFLPEGGQAGEAQVAFRLVILPEAGLISSARFQDWDGKSGVTSLDSRSQVWTDSGTELENGALVFYPAGRGLKPAVDINVSRPVAKAGVKVSQLKMGADALTIGMWFRSDAPSGRLFGKEGLTAFGKRYRTVSAKWEGGRIVASPGRLASEKLEPGSWNQVVLTANPIESLLYLNGREVARGEGSKELATDALDFLDGHAATLGEFRVYERVLTSAEIARWFDATRKDFVP